MMTNLNQGQRTLKLNRVTQIGFSAVLATMVGVGIISKLSMGRLVDALNWVSHTYEVEAELRALEKVLLDAETGERGFLFTNKEEFLEPYNSSIKELKAHFSKLEILIRDNPEQLKRLDRIEDLAQQKMDNLAQTIALKKAGKEQILRELVVSGTGKQIMDQIRARLDEMIDVEDELLNKRKEDASRTEQLTTLVSLGGTALAILLGILCLLFIARKVIRPINQVANIIASSSSEIAAMTTQQESIAAQQASSVHQATATMDKLGASSKQSAEQAEVAATGARQVASLAETGTRAVEYTLEDMAILREKVLAIAEQILCLSEQTNQIRSISGLVSDLANQTNMLALNAAVEAVRAGEHGKGFAVVASEIRKLADQSKKSAGKINILVAEIQGAINSTMMVTNEGTKTVEQGVKTAEGTAETFIKVANAISSVVMSSQQISLTAKQQAIAVQQVVDAMNILNQGATETACGISQTKTGTLKLNEAALNLQAVV
ncbi:MULTISPECIES: CHASE3 domain-containing protein [Cyanophyceae]|uniref:CHASE3 domain-containing protein n=1 Tax=Cyanophyceae TaxID=3028117 RepID=UPI001F54F287|nr:CHASE3 domain-containing protein [Trichocoleus sp. FACHB-69]